MSMLSVEAEVHGSGGSPQASNGTALPSETSPLCGASAARASSNTVPTITSTSKLTRNGRDELLFPSSHCGGNESSTTTSLDADDEADPGPPADTAELASAPSSAPVYPAGHSWLVESCEGDSQLRQVDTIREEMHEASTHDTQVPLPRSTGAVQNGVSGNAVQLSPADLQYAPALRGRQFSNRLTRSKSPYNREAASSSDATPLSSPMVPRSTRVSLSQPPSTFALSVVGNKSGQSGCVAVGELITSCVQSVACCAGGDEEGRVNLSSSPLASPPSLRAPSTTQDFSDGSPASRNSDALCSPVSMRRSAELQQFGCCVFFFPAPLVSWLFPLIGHVGISNAEGSSLFTFESSYYVREEKLVAVLDRVLREEMESSVLSSPSRRSRFGLNRFERDEDRCGHAYSPGPAQSPLPLRVSGTSDASTSDTGLPTPSDRSALSPAQRSASTPLFPPRLTARPPRRTGRSKAAGGAPATGHTHTRCVRIWDLKPLLMESRGRRTKRAPYSITTEGGRQAAVAFWERLQELLQPAEGAAGTSNNANGAARSQPASHTCGRISAEPSSSAEGGHSTTTVSSSSGDDEDGGEYELLDAETAYFYNCNLNATIRLFRGSADGSNNSPDVVLQHHSSFSFVGFVLEACGIGSQAKLSTSSPASASGGGSDSNGSQEPGRSSRANESVKSPDGATVAPENSDTDEEIHWGPMKVLFHVFVFGKWHRGEGRLRRALHGGSITSAGILWIIVLAVCFHYFRLMLV